jgi:hypothetical protein
MQRFRQVRATRFFLYAAEAIILKGLRGNMRLLILLGIAVCVVVAGFAAVGLGLRVLGYASYGAFGNLFGRGNDPTMNFGLATWIAYFVVSVGITFSLCVAYRKARK